MTKSCNLNSKLLSATVTCDSSHAPKEVILTQDFCNKLVNLWLSRIFKNEAASVGTCSVTLRKSHMTTHKIRSEKKKSKTCRPPTKYAACCDLRWQFCSVIFVVLCKLHNCGGWHCDSASISYAALISITAQCVGSVHGSLFTSNCCLWRSLWCLFVKVRQIKRTHTI